MRIFLLVLLLTISRSTLSQSVMTPYEKNDELQYKIEFSTFTEMETPQGTMPVDVSQNSEVKLIFTSNDSARAVFTKFDISIKSPQVQPSPSTDSLIGEEFVLFFNEEGHAEMVSMPEFSEGLAANAGLGEELIDFFVPVPEKALVIGKVWRDTLASTFAGYSAKNLSRFQVMGDTLINGRNVSIVHSDTEITVDSSVPESKMTMSFQGKEKGRLLFETKSGLMLLRERSASMKGEMRIDDGTEDGLVMPQSMKFDHKVEIIRD